jgi:hypothetical protein
MATVVHVGGDGEGSDDECEWAPNGNNQAVSERLFDDEGSDELDFGESGDEGEEVDESDELDAGDGVTTMPRNMESRDIRLGRVGGGCYMSCNDLYAQALGQRPMLRACVRQ